MSRINKLRICAGGVLWMMVYNVLWGIAWFAFMRKEWLNAAAALNEPMPWTAEVWAMWIAVTLPIGVAIVAYAASQASAAVKTAVKGTLPLWLILTLGMVGITWEKSYSVRVITLDSTVNLAAMVLASLAGGWSQLVGWAPFAVSEKSQYHSEPSESASGLITKRRESV